MRLLVGFLIISSTICAPAQRSAPRIQHGTVNIILANPQGMVVVTDSMLVSSNAPPERGQKLFKIDDHTICSIAGWYASSGPSIDRIHRPAYTAVPTIIRWYVSRDPSLARLPIDQKIKILASVIRFGLETMSAVDVASDTLPSDQPSQITLSGIDSGHFKIARLDLVPRKTDHGLVYDEKNESVTEVQDVLIYAVTGIPYAAQPILENRNSPGPPDPILQMYADAMTKDGGKKLSLEEMEQVAKRLKFITATRFSALVGGESQIAEIKDGKAEVTETPFDNDHEPLPMPTIMNRWTAPHLNGTEYGMVISGPGSEFVEDGEFSGVKNQPLDHIFFFRTKFTHCVLYYNGTPNFIFDKSNTVTDSKLVVTSGLASPAVEQIRSDFPHKTNQYLIRRSLIPTK